MKRTSLTVFSTLCAIALIGLIAYQFVPNAKELAKINRCPYEAMECPNTQAALAEHNECMQAADSIYEANEYLEGQLSLYKEKFGPIGGHEAIVKGNEQ